MDDFLGALIGSVFGIVVVLAIGAVVGAAWLLWRFCELVLPVLFEATCEGCEWAATSLSTWWRKVTWKRRMLRTHRQALRDIDAVRRQTVAQTRLLVAELDREYVPTAGATPAVRVAVRSAVRHA